MKNNFWYVILGQIVTASVTLGAVYLGSNLNFKLQNQVKIQEERRLVLSKLITIKTKITINANAPIWECDNSEEEFGKFYQINMSQ